MSKLRRALLLCVLLIAPAIVHSVAAQTPNPELFTYEELVKLYEQESVPPSLRPKLNRLLTTPFVSNVTRSAEPRPPHTSKLGRFLRLGLWNIERGLEYEAIELALTDPEGFSSVIDSAHHARDSRERALAIEEARLLSEADIIVLNEVDWGLKRTGYKHIAAELAKSLGMNYAYGVEFIEVDPIALGTEGFAGMDEKERRELMEQLEVDPSYYKGLHGNAILSRYPLENVRLIPFRHQPYDWYAGEKNGISKIEWGKRKAGEIVFMEKIRRQVRRGGRMMLLAEIADPSIPGGRLTIVATHLEARATPEGRRRQLEEVLAQIKDIKHPVVLAGDMNTSTKDNTPTSIQREIKKRLGSKKFWIKESLKWLTGLEIPYNILLRGYNEYRKQADPTVKHVPFVASNPEAGFFERLKEFRFADGGAFDFRGERLRSAGGKNDPLANSNQRGGKGFVTTYEVERRIGFIGKFKLDWFFVKPGGLTNPYDTEQPHAFAPHFGRTLTALNFSIEDRLSDHSPLIIDLPFTEPSLRQLAPQENSHPPPSPQRLRERRR